MVKATHGMLRVATDRIRQARGSRPNGLLNAISGRLDQLVLPHSDRQPVGVVQCGVRGQIPGPVRINLGTPKFRVDLWPGPVLLAAMPEAPVYKHRNPWSGED
jgi:hypothetical protein